MRRSILLAVAAAVTVVLGLPLGGRASGAPPPLHVTIAPPVGTLTGNDSGEVLVAGTASCSESAQVFVNVTLAQNELIPVSGSGFVESMPCDPTPRAWSVTISPSPTAFVNGPAQLTVDAFAFSSGGSANSDNTYPVTISGISTPADPEYYLALGDSLATGFAAGPGQGYVDLLEAHYREQVPNLVEVDFGCSSETTASMLDGSICQFGGLSQEDAAVAFLEAHRDYVALVTIDIGGNDIVFCTTEQCFADALVTMDANLATILSRLRQAAGPDVPFYGMNYFDPLLNNWLTGPTGQAYAKATVTILDELNAHLVTDYGAVGAPTADVAGAFASDDFTLVDSQWGQIPRNVFNACNWLDITCVVGGPEGFGDDANAAGYQVIAAAFEKVITPLAAPPTTTPPTTAPTPASAATSPPAVPIATAARFTG